MKRNRRIYIVVVLLLVLGCGAGCRRFVSPLMGDKVLARVGDELLTVSDVRSIFTPGLAPEDSLRMLETYVDMWVKKQLKIQEAEDRFPESVPDIERRVAEYRNSLLSLKLDDYLVSTRVDTLFTADEVQQYYNDNRGDYLLDREIFTGRMVRIPDDYRQRGKVKELLRSESEAQRLDLADICQKNGFECREFTVWTDLSELLALLPRSVDARKAFLGEGVQEAREGTYYYYFVLTARRGVGEAVPMERAEAAIKRTLATRRRADILRAYEDSIYNAAVSRRSIVINVE